jgi:hypothetical protein
MRTHRLSSLLRIAPFNGLENSFVMNLPALGSPRNTEDAQALLAQKTDNRVE